MAFTVGVIAHDAAYVVGGVIEGRFQFHCRHPENCDGPHKKKRKEKQKKNRWTICYSMRIISQSIQRIHSSWFNQFFCQGQAQVIVIHIETAELQDIRDGETPSYQIDQTVLLLLSW